MKIFLVLSVLLIAGCSSSAPVKMPELLPADARFSAPKIEVVLEQAIEVDGYPDITEFTRILGDKTIALMKEKSLLGENQVGGEYSVSIKVDWRRQFAGEATPFPSSSVMQPIVGYELVVRQGSVERYRFERSGLTTQKGFVDNLRTGFTLGLGKDARDEEEDIQVLANTFILELQALRVR